MRRIITYDLYYAEYNKYVELYKVFERLNGRQITESTYVIDTPLSQETVVSMIKNVIHKEDSVYYISVDTNNKIFYKKI